MAAMLAMMPLAGCSSPAEGKNVQDGVFEGSAEGYNGTITTEVKFQDGKIADITVTNENETTTVSDYVLKAVPDAIVANQSVNIDTTSGATVTAEGVLGSVKDAIKQAGGNVKEWKGENKVSLKYAEKKISTDVVVVGGGVAGLSTALRLQQIGVDTTILEKDDALGGVLKDVKYATQLVGSEFDTEETETDMDTLKSEISEKGNGNTTLLDILMSRLDETVQWQLNTLGVPFEDKTVLSGTFTQDNLKQYSSSANTIGELLGKEAEVSGARILFSTSMINVEENEDGTVVTAKGKDGTTYTVSAQYVVLATGSDTDSSSQLVSVASERSENDTLKIAENEKYKTSEGTAVSYGLSVKCDDDTYVDIYDFLKKNVKNGAFLMDEDGNRFCNEEMNRLDLSEKVCSDKKDVYLVLNEKTYASFKSMLEKNKNVSDEVKEKISSDSLEGVEYSEDLNTLSVNPLSAIEQLNDSFFESGENEEYADTTGRTDFYGEMTAEGPYTIVKLSHSQLYSSAGIETDEHLHVINEDDSVSNRVYAVGSTCGSITGSETVSGVSSAWTFVSGKAVADEISGILVPDALNKILAKETGNS